jgi:hypothetical protein
VSVLPLLLAHVSDRVGLVAASEEMV